MLIGSKYISIDKLYKIFFTNSLVKISLSSVPQIVSLTNQNHSDIELSPASYKLLKDLSPESKKKMRRIMIDNDIAIGSYELKDPDYIEKLNNAGLGLQMEKFVALNARCPVCGLKTLHSYEHFNIPVVDLICVNSEHLVNKTCFLFQLKIGMDDNYFDRKRKIITVGSQNYGWLPHNIKTDADIKSKFIVPGYICLSLTPSYEDIQNYVIRKSKSFILIPNYNIESVSENYYKYLSGCFPYGKNAITWNSKTVDIHPYTKILDSQIVDRLTNLITTTIKNPYSKLKFT